MASVAAERRNIVISYLQLVVQSSSTHWTLSRNLAFRNYWYFINPVRIDIQRETQTHH